MNVYEIDTLVTVSVAFARADKTPFDPSVVALFYTDPSGAPETEVPMVDLANPAPGLWSFGINVGVHGVWTYKFQGSGNCAVTTKDAFFLVNPSALLSG